MFCLVFRRAHLVAHWGKAPNLMTVYDPCYPRKEKNRTISTKLSLERHKCVIACACSYTHKK